MNLLRWLISVPAAFAVALIADMVAHHVALLLPIGGPPESVVGALPLFVVALISTTTFVLAGFAISPGRGRRTALLFAVLALLFSPALAEVRGFYLHGWHIMSAACLIGIIVGASLGGFGAVRIAWFRRKTPNQVPEPTSGLAPGRGSS